MLESLSFKLNHFFNKFFLLESPRAHLHLVGMLQFMFLTKTNRACPLLFILFLSVSNFMALSTVFHFISSPTNSRFLTLFIRSYFCLIGPFKYISLYESLPQP